HAEQSERGDAETTQESSSADEVIGHHQLSFLSRAENFFDAAELAAIGADDFAADQEVQIDLIHFDNGIFSMTCLSSQRSHAQIGVFRPSMSTWMSMSTDFTFVHGMR